MRSPVWVCLGLGTDSIAMLIEMVLRKEPIDLITFADTGAEMPRTYSMLEPMNTFLRSHNYPEVVVVRYSTRSGNMETLEESVLRNKTVPALAFGWHTCSIRFKIKPQVDFAKKFQPFLDAWKNGVKVTRCIGYDFSPADSKRANRPTTEFPDLEEFENRFPLREWKWTRVECLDRILSAGLPDPGKSSCYFCPARKKDEIRDMALNQPEMFAKALDMEARALAGGKLRTVKGLGRNFAWRDVK